MVFAHAKLSLRRRRGLASMRWLRTIAVLMFVLLPCKLHNSH
jgi:hypothetical protein